MTLINILLDACFFEPLQLSSECPSNTKISALPECTSNMAHGSLCEADLPLPDGNSNFDVDNCGAYDVFRCRKGTKPMIDITSSYQLITSNKMYEVIEYFIYESW